MFTVVQALDPDNALPVIAWLPKHPKPVCQLSPVSDLATAVFSTKAEFKTLPDPQQFQQLLVLVLATVTASAPDMALPVINQLELPNCMLSPVLLLATAVLSTMAKFVVLLPIGIVANTGEAADNNMAAAPATAINLFIILFTSLQKIIISK